MRGGDARSGAEAKFQLKWWAKTRDASNEERLRRKFGSRRNRKLRALHLAACAEEDSLFLFTPPERVVRFFARPIAHAAPTTPPTGGRPVRPMSKLLLRLIRENVPLPSCLSRKEQHAQAIAEFNIRHGLHRRPWQPTLQRLWSGASGGEVSAHPPR